MDLPGIAAIRRRALIAKERDGANLELAFLACAQREGLKPEILSTPDCRIQVGGRQVYVEIRYRRGPITLRVIHEEARQLSRAEAEHEPSLILFGGPGTAPVPVLQSALIEFPHVSAILLWGVPMVVVSRTAVLRAMPLAKALRAALD